MRTFLRAVKIAFKVLLAAAMGLLLAYNIYMLVARYALDEGMPTVFGYGSAVVVSGSMEPAIGVGDFVITRRADTYAEGDVITFFDSTRGEYVTHRIIAVSEEGYATRGDANSGQDKFTVKQDAVVGKVVAVWEGFGKTVQFLQSPVGFFSVIAVLVGLWLVSDLISYLIGKNRDQRDERERKGEKD